MAIIGVKCLFTYTMGDRNAANVINIAVDDTEMTDPQGLSDELSLYWGTLVHEDATAASCIYTGVQIVDHAKTWMAATSASAPGTASGAMAGPAACYLLKKTLFGTTKSGRSYLPGVPEAVMNDLGVITGGTITYILAQQAAFWAAMEALYPSLVEIVPTKTNPGATVIGRSVDGKIATQRRRLRA